MDVWKRAHYVTPENELIAKEENRQMVYEQRRSMLLPKTAVERERYTCRDQQGHARLMPHVDLMDVIEALCRVEEQRKGVLVKGLEGQALYNSEFNKRRHEEKGK